jgi:hypothetical protein
VPEFPCGRVVRYDYRHEGEGWNLSPCTMSAVQRWYLIDTDLDTRNLPVG